MRRASVPHAESEEASPRPRREAKRPRPIVPALVLLLFASAPLAARARDPRVDVQQFRSGILTLSGLQLSTVTLLEWEDAPDSARPVRPRINMTLANMSDSAVWIEVRLMPPPPHPGRVGVAHLGSYESIEFESTQDSLLAEVDYPLDISVFADSALTDTLEHHALRMWFDRESVDSLGQRLALRTLEAFAERDRRIRAEAQPRVFERIVMKKDMGFLSSLSGRLGRSGTVAVGPDRLEFSNKGGTFAVAAAWLRGVSMRASPGGASGEWVVVEYVTGAKTQTLWLTPSPFASGNEYAIMVAMCDAIGALIRKQGGVAE